MSRPRGVHSVLVRLVTLLCAALLVTGATALAGILVIRHETALTRTTITPLVDTSHELRSDLLQARSAFRGYVLTGEPSFAAEYGRTSRELGPGERRLGELADGRLEERELELLGAEVDEWLAVTGPVVAAASEAPTDLDTSRPHMDRALSALDSLDAQILALRQESRERNRQAVRLALGAVVLVTALSTGLTLWALRRADRLLAVPLQRLHAVVEHQRDGATRADTSAGALEVVAVARAFNRFSDEARDLAEKRRQAIEQLQELDRQKSDFLSTTNHELRTPLTSISGYLEMLEDGDLGELNPAQRQALEVVHRNTRRLQLLIEDVLLLNRIDRGREKMRRDRLDLAGCVDAVLLSLAPQAARARVRVDAPARGSWPVTGDSEQLERAIGNVVGNALKCTPPGGAVELALRAGPDGTTVQLHCADTGMGVPADEVGSLFTSFTRASNATARQVPGTGLGLVIVRAVAEQHGGRVRLDSVEGEGTHVVLELPLAPAEEPVPV